MNTQRFSGKNVIVTGAGRGIGQAIALRFAAEEAEVMLLGRTPGLLGLNRTMALELAKYQIRVNCVSPGFTHTPMTEKAVGPQLMDYLLHSFDRVPMRRLVRTDEVAAAFAYLASDDASAITGTE